jgi:hypothetical protein
MAYTRAKVLPLPLPSQCPVAVTVLFWLAPNAKNFKTGMFYRSNNYPTTNYFNIQINHQPDATIFQFIILTFIYSSTCVVRFPAHHQELNDCSGSLWFYLRIVVIVVLCSWSGRPDHEHSTTVTTI